jgi:protein tyrosine/serine phosphatase
MTRHIDFEGIENFRDFVGYGASDGRTVKPGVLYRSANHTYATEADLQRMRELGVAAIIDLRRPDERTREPSKRWAGFQGQVVENDIESAHADWAETMKGVTLTPQWFLDDGVAYYRRGPFEARHIDLWSRYFRTLAEAPGAIVVHCAAGKDRTGMICALTHHIAGVHPDDIMADFLETNNEERMARKMSFLGPWLRETVGQTVSDDALRVAVGVHADYLNTALGVIRERHGSIDAYLAEVLGVDETLRERLYERLLG